MWFVSRYIFFWMWNVLEKETTKHISNTGWIKRFFGHSPKPMQINVTDLRCDIVPTYLDAKTEPEKAHKCFDIFLRSLNGLLGKYKRIGVFLVPWHLKQTAYIDMIHEDAILIFDLGWKDPTALFLQTSWCDSIAVPASIGEGLKVQHGTRFETSIFIGADFFWETQMKIKYRVNKFSCKFLDAQPHSIFWVPEKLIFWQMLHVWI